MDDDRLSLEVDAPDLEPAPSPEEAPAPEEASPTPTPDPEQLRRQVEDFRKRNAGLQRRLQQELQARRALEARIREFEEALYAQSLGHLPPEERMARLQAFRQQRQAWDQQARLQEAEAELERKAKVLVAHELARRYGVPVEDLLDFNDPESMEKYARRVGSAARRSPAANRFEGAEPAPPGREKPKSLDEAASLFRSYARRLGI